MRVETTSNMMNLLDLPYELLGSILRQADPTTWAKARQTCKTLRDYIDRDLLLYKDYYLMRWDNPMHIRGPMSKQWIEDVKKLVKMEKILASTNGTVKEENFDIVAQCVLDLISSAAPEYTSNNMKLLRRHFRSHQNQQAFMCNSSLFTRARRERPELRSQGKRREMSAKLHCLHGKAIEEASVELGQIMYPYACSKVYDLRSYTTNTMWGPFKADGSEQVDWEMTEAIMMVLAHNLRQCRVFIHRFIKPIWDLPFSGVASNSHIVKENLHQLPSPNSMLEDPYGINGTWMRVVCFLDYTELFAYNFTANPVPRGEPRPPLNTEEAIRMIVMHIKITKIESPGPNDGQALPVVHFHGNSRPRYAHWDPNAIAHVRGYVRLTKEGEVHWTTFSIYHGEERWRSEGIQVGGVRAARGVVGCWFDKDYDRHGPAGPTAFWKISEENSIDVSDSEGEEETTLVAPGELTYGQALQHESTAPREKIAGGDPE